MKKLISNWNNYPVVEADEISFDYDLDLPQKLNGSVTIPHGNGRCYGDASLSGRVINTLRFDKILSFDVQQGIITCQSGLLLSDLLQVIVPRGWFLPVTPGTKFITVGGAVASDVHGKNHHVDGSFSRHVKRMAVLTGMGALACSKDNNADLFWATCGGMGLTGVILDVTFQLKKIETSFLKQKQIKAENLDEAMVLFAEHSDYTYSVAWIDCLKTGNQFGRSILILGEHATEKELSGNHSKLTAKDKSLFSVPFNFPSFVLNQWSVKAFNAMYYAKNYQKVMDSVVHYDGFFYPLDSILNWNRIYGSRGFVQYQFVLPLKQSKDGLKKILGRINKVGMGSFLAVLKLFGEQNDLISFPMEGYTLALDFPMRPGLLAFLDELDEVVADFGGRIYLSKDARMKKGIFWETYPNAKRFKDILKKYDPDNRFVSNLSTRLMLKD
jgi:decaprenylphospho-beta-D-ribofuranose 2-oxidase